MALFIIQIPTDKSTSYSASSVYDEMIPVNWKPIAPVTVKLTDDISALFKFRYILRVYVGSVADANLLATLKQRPNNFSTTTNSNAIFDIKGILNTQIDATFPDSNDISKEIHKVGNNVTNKIFSLNDTQVKTIIIKATYEYATTSTSAPIEVTTGYVQISMECTMASFGTFEYITYANPLDQFYNTSNNQKYLFTDQYDEFEDVRQYNQQVGGGSILKGRLNYVTGTSDYHTLAFMNKTAFGSDGNFLCLKYYDSSGSLVVTYTFENDITQGGEPPSSANDSSEYLLYAGVGTANLESYVGACYKDGIALTPFDGQPSSIIPRWAYYSIFMCDKATGTAIRSRTYYFVKDYIDNTNCKDIEIIRLGWTNSLGAWDYFNFNAGQTQRIESERMNYGQLLGTEFLDSANNYNYYNWQGGTRTLYNTAKLRTSLTTQYITKQEGDLLENLFKSNNVMIIESGSVVPVSQSVVISNKSFVIKETAKDKLQIQYTFDIEYSNELNTNS